MEEEEFNEKRENAEEKQTSADLADKKAKEERLLKILKKQEKDWEDKRKSQQDIELEGTSTSRFAPTVEEYEETSFDRKLRAIRKIKENLPQCDELNSPFVSEMDENDRVEVWLTNRVNAEKYFLFNENGRINEKLPSQILKSLGPTREEISAQEDQLDYKTEFDKERVRNKDLESKLSRAERDLNDTNNKLQEKNKSNEEIKKK